MTSIGPFAPTERARAPSTLAKTVLTGAALAATACSRVLGKKLELASSGRPENAEKAAEHPVDTDWMREIPGGCDTPGGPAVTELAHRPPTDCTFAWRGDDCGQSTCPPP
ncbi:hypothetical protein ACWKT5_31400 [Streptomyces avermitilis]